MKKILIPSFFIFAASLSFGQGVGINNNGANPANSAMLDVVATDKGILVPRVALTTTNAAGPITAPATSLLVYNTATAGAAPNNVTPGFYYWSGAAWQRFDTDNNTGDWKILGNANTTAGTNFIGTTNAQHLDFRTNNTQRVRIMNSTYPTVGIGTAFPVTNLSGNSAVVHIHDGGASVGSQLVLSTHATANNSRVGLINFASTQTTNNRVVATIESNLTAASGTNASGDLRFFTNNVNNLSERFRIPNADQVHAMANGTAAFPFYSWGNDPNTGMSSLAADQLNWSTGGTERLRLTITQLATTFNGSAGTPAYSFTTDTDIGMYRIGANTLGFSTSGAERIRIAASGQVGVNGAAAAGDLFAVNAVAANPFSINGYTSGNGTGVYGLRLAGTSGNWGAVQGELVATAPNGSNGVSGLVNNTNHRGVFGQKPAGGLQWGGLFVNDLGYTGFFGNASDQRFKKDITKIDNALESILSLKTYKYHYTEPELGGDHVYYYGYMAQEIEEIFPDMVQEKDFTPSNSRSFDNGSDKDLKIKAVSTISLIPILTQAIQEQQAIIQEQQAIIDELINRLEDLEKIINQK